MGFINDDAVEFIHRRGCIRGKNAANHGLYRRDLYSGFCLCRHIAELSDIVNLRQRLVLLQRRFFKGVRGLVAQSRAVNQKQDALEAFSFQKTVHQANNGACFPGAGRHRQKGIADVLSQCAFNGENGLLLIIA
ncbi:hypothetical protein D3C80_1665100 [compost metagenome]